MIYNRPKPNVLHLPAQPWYVGGSIRHFNHPYTEWSYATRLHSTDGIQAGYTAPISSSNDLDGYCNFTWKAGTTVQINSAQCIGARYIHHLNDSTNNAFSFGFGLRAGNALIPDADFQVGGSPFMFYYEINISGMPSGNYHRRTLELSYKLNL